MFARGIVILSLDTEQIWGYSDLLNEPQFHKRYPGAHEAHDKVLGYFCDAGVSATWFMVGGMALSGSDGPRDRRMAGLPLDWTGKIPSGSESTAPLWYRRSFVERLREAGVAAALLFVVGEERDSAGAREANLHPKGSRFLMVATKK